MNLFKPFSDMAKMVNAAPGLIQQANELQAQAAVYQQQMAAQNEQAIRSMTAQPDPQHLGPIAGVDLELYTRIVKTIGTGGYDEARLAATAGAYGVSPEAWREAQAGWGSRIQVDRGLGRRFNELYRTV